jgi:hypothetical protein
MTKFIILYFLLILRIGHISSQSAMTPFQVVQENLDFYNQRNIDGFISSFVDSVSLCTFGKDEPVAQGKEAIRILYNDLFISSPKLHSTILNRVVLGNKVIDHEYIVGRKGSDVPIELVMIYEVSDGKISRMTVIRK